MDHVYPPGTVTADHLWLEQHALAHTGVRVRTLHPDFARRLRLLLEALYAAKGYRTAVVKVGERLRSEGMSLWIRRNLPAGDPNRYPYVVANPTQDNGIVAGTTIHVIGSYHFRQSDGWAHAADVVPANGGSYGAIHKQWRLLGGEFNGAGLGLYVASEPWHWQWLRHAGILPGPVASIAQTQSEIEEIAEMIIGTTAHKWRMLVMPDSSVIALGTTGGGKAPDVELDGTSWGKLVDHFEAGNILTRVQ